MRFLVASALLASLLALGGGVARADASAQATPPAPRIGLTGRCLEQPMSLALAIAEYEASRALAAHSLVSPAEPVVATPREPAAPPPADIAAALPRRSALPPPACVNSDDPGCRFSQPLSTPVQVHLDHVDHGGAPAVWATPVIPCAAERGATPRDRACDPALAAHARGPWRPPAR